MFYLLMLGLSLLTWIIWQGQGKAVVQYIPVRVEDELRRNSRRYL